MSANALQKLIKNNLTGINAKNVYAFSINSGNVSLTDPVFLVTEILFSPSDYGGDQYNSMNEKLQVQIYYSDTTQINAEKLESDFLKLLKQNNYLVFDISGHEAVPETKTLVITYKFNHIKEI
ncbi:Hypothetical protein ADU71_1304 [Pediococcus damnosus]|uniref:DUF806 family protein n=1 Tax=Pediococcus damnosus TaxID=51663 RepID=UPI00078CA70B|nr:DUF806 family protein [Pediococcus damnosus]AMV65200.1 Hypothetical protein ADU71_1304 [Pediococcus damnosus]